MRKRAVVTGGAGFLGSHLCERLLDDGYDVVCLDNFITGAPANIAHPMQRDGFRLVRVDVTEFIYVSGRVDAVLHFASPVDYLQLPIETLKVGSLGTWRSLGLAREKNARFVLASTSEVYGGPLVHPQPESYWGNLNPVGPRGVYDEAKRYAEALTEAYRQRRGVDTATARIFNTFGPRMRPDDGRAIPAFIHQALAGRPGQALPSSTSTGRWTTRASAARTSASLSLCSAGYRPSTSWRDCSKPLTGSVRLKLASSLRPDDVHVRGWWAQLPSISWGTSCATVSACVMRCTPTRCSRSFRRISRAGCS